MTEAPITPAEYKQLRARLRASRDAAAYLPVERADIPLPWATCLAVWGFVLVPIWLGIIAALRWWLS